MASWPEAMAPQGASGCSEPGPGRRRALGDAQPPVHAWLCGDQPAMHRVASAVSSQNESPQPVHAWRCGDKPAMQRAAATVSAQGESPQFRRSGEAAERGCSERDGLRAGCGWITAHGRDTAPVGARMSEPAAPPAPATDTKRGRVDCRERMHVAPSGRWRSCQPVVGAAACSAPGLERADAPRTGLAAGGCRAAPPCPRIVENAQGVAAHLIHHLSLSQPCSAGAGTSPSAARVAAHIVVLPLILISCVWLLLRDAYSQLGRSPFLLVRTGKRIRTGALAPLTHMLRRVQTPSGAGTRRELPARAGSSLRSLSAASLALTVLLFLQSADPAAAQLPGFGVR